ncbi:integrase, catalytic region, zinc finger, CCHC-type containing protein [Tanacetum coccineum]
MANLSKDIQSASSDTHPPMLDRENILQSIDEDPFKMGKFRETLADGALGPERDRVIKDLTPEEKERFKPDIRAMNILLQGLPKDIYTLINHYTDAKYIWNNVKMLLEGSELTKDERESQLYDDFEHSRQNKGETIHEYYVKFTKLINDMRNNKMTMPKMQLNSKFMNNMLPEWGRFVTTVKLNRGLKTSNYGQLHAYLKQHEAHANKNKMMLERYNQHDIDPLAFVSNISPQQYPIQSSGRQNRGQGNNARGAVAAGNGAFQNRIGNASPGQAKPIKCYNCNGIGYIARQCTHPKRKQNSKYFEDKMLLMQAQENGVVLDEEQLLFIAGGQTNTFDDDVDEAPVQDLALNKDNVFQADQCDAFDSDVDEAPTSQTMFMENLSSADIIYDEACPSYDLDILSEVQDHDNYLDSVDEYQEVHEMHNDVQQNYVVDSDAEYTSNSNIISYDQYVKNNVEQVVQSNVPSVPNDALMMIINDMHDQTTECVSANEQNKVVNESLTAELVRYKEQVLIYEKRARFELTKIEQKIDEQMRIIITDRNTKEETLKRELHSVKMQLNSTIDHNKLMKEDAMQVQSALYNGHEIVKTNHAPAVVHDSEDTLEIAEKTRKKMLKKMLEKMKSPLCVEKRVKIAPPDYLK